MSRSLAEAWARACSASSSGSPTFMHLPLLRPEVCATKPRLSSNPQNCITPNPLRPFVPATECFTKWLTPYGLAHLDKLSQWFPIDIIICHWLCLANSILPLTLSNYSAGLLRLTKFCDDHNIPEAERMPASESLLSHFIALCGAASVGKGAMSSWLEGLWLWHQVNEAPWHGSQAHKRVVKGASKFALVSSSQPKCEPVTIKHLKSLHWGLDLSNLFDIAVFAVRLHRLLVLLQVSFTFPPAPPLFTYASEE